MIVEAIRMLAEQDEAEQLQKRAEVETSAHVREIAAEIVREIFRELRKAGFNPNEPRVPAGNPGGGEWTREGAGSSSNNQLVVSDATPDNNRIPGAQYAANDPPSIGPNQGRPLDAPPKITSEQPATRQALYAFLRAAAYWLEEAALAGEPAGDFILALEAASWLSKYLPYISAYLDPPKTLAELQQVR